ncbi:hypothetical protein [Candidatus Accumulibacter cognatus]|uniref:hypothetical protein n=1 Tax=Candidatus Accumulibacter cognatus TaxID=2954383 RepID=UPI0030811CBA
MANDHDTGYKFLFSHPEMVRDLLIGFIQDDWLHNPDGCTSWITPPWKKSRATTSPTKISAVALTILSGGSSSVANGSISTC